MTILVTGVAGFIGFHTSLALLDKQYDVVGVDNLSDYYAVSLKQSRLSILTEKENFRFVKADLADHATLVSQLDLDALTHIVHLGAQPGVRYSLENPFAYTHANIEGHLSILELARHAPKLEHLVYASSSSVYGGNTKQPFSETDPVTKPVSLYAATKRADELMSESYNHLYGIPQTGLRFFTVYGPWGRPDMAPWIFTEAIFNDQPVEMFHEGQSARDYTYIDDAVEGILKVLGAPPDDRSHRIYNLGNDRPEHLHHFVDVIEKAVGKPAHRILKPAQPGDVQSTHADISAIRRDFDFAPRTNLDEGLPRFVDWFKTYFKL